MRPIDSTQPASSNLGPVVFSEDQIRDRVTELAAELSRDHTDKIPVIIGVLTGTVIFMDDLLRAISIPVEVDFIAISPLDPSRETHGAGRGLKDLERPLGGRLGALV